ncbi:L-cysteine desulfidase family protein [Psychromonas sp. CD1]|uniref:L-cysteine desulfidase family protein n=1 Tax=Psychromonas sp. CD1 TaxID=1979839 RepID=UPI000B9AD5C9|nr:L-serine ammonia-lyase, iron-sulfur-dependent, subunit alpha [Psychromonas sp. CD1]
MKTQWQQYINILKSVVKPALGCTEPIAVAYASAVAMQMLDGEPEKITVQVSDNLYKNSMGVFVPGTGQIGLRIAASVGAFAGDPLADLQVLENITNTDVEKAQTLIDANNVEVSRIDVDEFIYCLVEIKAGNNIAIVEVSGAHTQVISKKLNGKVVFTKSTATNASTASICDGVDITVEGIYNFAMQAPFADIEFILESARLNSTLADEGLTNDYGLKIGRIIQKSIKDGFMSDDLVSNILMHTSAASDARMGGASLPAMSNYGSGNQGIAATLPVMIMSKHCGHGDDKLARALILSNLVAIYIKSYYPPLSAFCGNTATSSAVAMAMVYLMGGDYKQSCYAIQNVLGDCTGIICDGAKSTCALKVKTTTSSAIYSSMLAINATGTTDQGIIADNVEQTIRNLGKLVTIGMPKTDAIIIDIMSA